MSKTTQQTDHQRDAGRIRELLRQEILYKHQVSELLDLTRMGGQVPIADGHDSTGDYWVRGELEKWLQSDALHIRSAGATADRQRVAERGSVRSRTWNPKDRTFTAVIATENEVVVIDPFSFQPVREVLLVSGGLVPDKFPLLKDHRPAVDSILGQGFSPRQEGTVWLAGFRLADTQAAREVAQLIGEDMLRGVSIGYFYGYEDFVDVQPRESKTVAGRLFTNDQDRVLRVVHRWQLRETSIVPFPADESAKIRSISQQTQGNNAMSVSTAPSVHSRNSITGRATRGELVSALLLQAGMNDPSACRAMRDHHTGLPTLRNQTPQLVREAEGGFSYSHRNPVQLLAMAAELSGIRISSLDSATVFSRLFRACQQRSASTSNLAGIYQDVIAGIILSRHNDGGDSTEGWCDENETTGFRRTAPTVQVSGIELTKQAINGVADDVSFETTDEATTMAQYTAQFLIDEQDFLDGRAGEILSTIPQQLGDAAAALRPNLVYAYLLRNPTMRDGVPLFHADHGNLNPAAGLASPGALETAASNIARNTQGDVKLNLRASHLIVPTALEHSAAALVKLFELINPDSQQPPTVRSDSRLDDGLVDPTTGNTLTGSTTSWYLSTAGKHALQVSYMTGSNKSPEIRTGFLDQTTGSFGFATDVRMFLGVTANDYRGIVRNDA